MCPQCYLTALVLAVGGSSTVALIQHPVTIVIGVLLTIAAIYFIYKGYKKNKGTGGLQRNLFTTFLVIASFLLGYLVAAYQTHDYFQSKSEGLRIDANTELIPMIENDHSD